MLPSPLNSKLVKMDLPCLTAPDGLSDIVNCSAMRPIFLCGDSHCLSGVKAIIPTPILSLPPWAQFASLKCGSLKSQVYLSQLPCFPIPSAAWRTVRLRGEIRLVRPLLVTGCKIWHLRPESTFYPKVQFLNTIRKLPRGSQVRTGSCPVYSR